MARRKNSGILGASASTAQIILDSANPKTWAPKRGHSFYQCCSNKLNQVKMSQHLPLAAPLVDKQSLVVKVDKAREAANKGPVIRKSIEAFYFAAHAYGKLHNVPGIDNTAPPRGQNCNWIQVPSHGNASACKLAGLFSAWYPEVSTLVLAYAGSDDILMPVRDVTLCMIVM